MLKKILIGLAVIIVAFVVVVALQPSEVRVVRSITITAPAPVVFAQVNDFHKWEAWSPWAKLDPAAKVTFEGTPAGQGAVFTWAGNDEVGEGRMTLTESRPDDYIKIDVAFVKPMEGTSTSEFSLKPEGNQTVVTWTTTGHNNFIGKALCLFVDMEEMLGGALEKGLAQLKSVAESAAGG
jgi:Polyketide cyclase / dehydrase and lipid transport